MVSEAPRFHATVPPRRYKRGATTLFTLFYVVILLAICSVAFYAADTWTVMYVTGPK